VLLRVDPTKKVKISYKIPQRLTIFTGIADIFTGITDIFTGITDTFTGIIDKFSITTIQKARPENFGNFLVIYPSFTDLI
jgi:hypothetical protein